MVINRPSFEKVDYSVRPAKNIERKMMAEFFGTLRFIHPLRDYVYVGFGATFFSDFILFHRTLNLQSMITIEEASTSADRVKFNLPYACIDPRFGESGVVLPSLPWDMPLIVWLDYDKRIDVKKLDDVKFCVQNARSGSAIVATFRVHPDDFQTATSGVPDLDHRLAVIRQDVEGRIPDSVTANVTANLDQSDRLIMNATIDESIDERNLVLLDSERVRYHQYFFFWYDDGTPMVTIGGLILNEADAEKFSGADLENMPFLSRDDAACRLRPPKLTLRERRHIDRQLPHREETDALECPDVLQEDLQEYERLYRYFPWFVEAEL